MDDITNHHQGIEYLRLGCESFQVYEAKTKKVVGDMTSVINMAVHRMRNAESVKETDEAYQDVLRATDRMNRELPGNKETING